MKVDTTPEALRVLADELDMEPPGPGRYAGRVLRALADEQDAWKSAMLRTLAEITGLVSTEDERAFVRKVPPPWERTGDGWVLTGPTGARYEFSTRMPDGRNVLHERDAEASAAYGAALLVVLGWKSDRERYLHVDDSPPTPALELLEGGKEPDDGTEEP